MNHLISSLSKTSALAALLGMVACADHQQANPPSNTAQAPSTTTEYGSTMSQSGAPGTTDNTSMGSTSGATTSGSGATNGRYGATDVAGGSSTSTTGNTMSQGAGGGTMGQSQSGTSGPLGQSGPHDAAALDDAQIAAVVVALNQGELQEAQLAQSKAKSTEVKNFASHMISAHQSMLTKSQKEFTGAQLTPSDSPVSQQLQTDVQSQLSTLQSMEGSAFDRTYLDDQVQAHAQALDMLDRMIGNTKNTQLKSSLQDARIKVENHLKDARRLQQKLQSS